MAKRLVFAFREVEVPDEPPLTARELILASVVVLSVVALVIGALALVGLLIGRLAGMLLA